MRPALIIKAMQHQQMRKCLRCHTEKLVDQFAFRSKRTGKRHTRCKECAAEYSRDYGKTRRESKGEYNKQYYGLTREEQLAQKRDYYARNREQIREKAARYREANREKVCDYSRSRYHADPEAARERGRQRNRKNKEAAFAAYGGARCACCGESGLAFLTIDHINGCTKEQRKREGLGSQFYVWLKKNSYPMGYQVLCFNCNMGRQVNGGVCPHKVQGNVKETRPAVGLTARRASSRKVRALPPDLVPA